MTRLQSLSTFACALACASLARAQTVFFSADGAPHDRLGTSVAELGDVDGDGVPELLVGTPGYDFTSLGGAKVLSGATGVTLTAVVGPSTGTYMGFGNAVHALGDVDGDGAPDFAVSTPFESSASEINAGFVRVFSSTTGALLLQLSGGIGDELFGTSVAAAGDLDGDGRADLFVGVPGVDVGPVTSAGAVRAVSGLDGSTLWQFAGSVLFEALGTRAVAAGDLDGDGVIDVAAVGGSLPIRLQTISGTTGQMLYPIGPIATASIVVSLAGGKDLDGDGIGDLALGDPFANRVRTFSGANGAPLATFTPSGSSCGLIYWGTDVALLDDRDGDGLADVAIHEATGLIEVLSGVGGARLFSLRRAGASALAASVDRDGDGRGDLLFGIPNAADFAGRVQVVVDDAPQPVGTVLALGDGTGAACPCGNVGGAGQGCATSTGSGASLRGLGSASLADVHFHLRTEGAPVGHLAVLFSAAQPANGGLGTPFGDGLKGLAGTLHRLDQKSLCAPVVDWTNLLGASIVPGASVYYQVWFRDPNGPCGGHANMTNVVAVTFAP
ncbi:MAG: FG-GAP repeat protein [Planctomycetes bacterium]|nr:FG-GAP repeat protein [Planctomycetota bacterium]